MPHYFIFWDDETKAHLAAHHVTPEEFEEVVQRPRSVDVSRTTGRPIAFGWTSGGRYLACVYEIDGDLVFPVTAYDVEP